MRILKVYESIITVLEEKGPLPILKICREVNRMLVADREKALLPSQIKSIVTRKHDLFLNKEGNISIRPDKQLLHLVFILDGEQGISYRVNVNFIKKRFIFCEWRNIGVAEAKQMDREKEPGDLTLFKREIFSLELWKWKSSNRKEAGIVLGAINWKLSLETKGKTYMSEGSDKFPENWNKFCKALEKLTGSTFQVKK